MITGDHAGTARAIAREMGIVGDGDVPVLTGPSWTRIDDEALRRRRAAHVDVYARTSPRAQAPDRARAAVARRRSSR